MLLGNQLQQLSLAHHGIRKIQPSEFDLPRMKDPERLAEPIVQRSMVFKLQSTNRMGDSFDRIRLAVSPIVHRVNAPIVSSAMMMRKHDPIKHRVAQIEVRRRHVDLGPKRSGPFGKLSVFHPDKQVQVFLDGSVSVGAVFARLGQSTPVLSHLLGT